MSLGVLLIDPADKPFVSVYWGDRFPSISNGTWSCFPSGPTLSGSTLIGGTTSGVYGTGFGAGTLYTLSNLVTSPDGQSEERSVVVRCEQI